MSQRSLIEWTDSTWNFVTGCTKVSPGCDACYACAFAERFRGVPGHPYEQGFDLRLWPDRLRAPRQWRKPRMVFVNSMSDLWHRDVPDAFVEAGFRVMEETPWHIYQVLTKRSERARRWTRARYCSRDLTMPGKRPWPTNAWLGVSVETRDYFWRIDQLRQTPATIKFISFDPLLGPIELTSDDLRGIDWVIVGGESGRNARRMDTEWVRTVREACQRDGVAFFFKQHGVSSGDREACGEEEGRSPA